MGLKDRKKIKIMQKIKRHKKRLKLLQKGLNLDDFYYGKSYIGHLENEEK